MTNVISPPTLVNIKNQIKNTNHMGMSESNLLRITLYLFIFDAISLCVNNNNIKICVSKATYKEAL